MKLLLTHFLFLFLAALAFVGASSSNTEIVFTDDEDVSAHRELQSAKLGEVLERIPSLSVLVAALKKTDLFNLFMEDESQTLFAPTDSAFVEFANITVSSIEELDPDSEVLALIKELLLYHVIPGAQTTGNLEEGAFLRNAANRPLNVRFKDTVIFVGPFRGAEILSPNQLSANGVLHIIGAVMNPTLPGDIPFVLGDINRMKTLFSAVSGAGLVPTLQGEGPFTIFAPTSAAFAALGDTFNDVIADTDLLTSILLYHVVPGSFYSQDMKQKRSKRTLTTVNGAKLRVRTKRNGNLLINGSIKVKAVNLDATNGVIHIINETLIPPSE